MKTNSSSPAEDSRARVWAALGRSLLASGRCVEAVDALEAALALGPLDFRSRRALVICYARIGREVSERVRREFLSPPERPPLG